MVIRHRLSCLHFYMQRQALRTFKKSSSPHFLMQISLPNLLRNASKWLSLQSLVIEKMHINDPFISGRGHSYLYFTFTLLSLLPEPIRINRNRLLIAHQRSFILIFYVIVHHLVSLLICHLWLNSILSLFFDGWQFGPVFPHCDLFCSFQFPSDSLRNLIWIWMLNNIWSSWLSKKSLVFSILSAKSSRLIHSYI